MFRLGFATLAVAAGIGLLCGCISLSNLPFFGRHRCVEGAIDCCDETALPAEGPVLGECNPTVVAPGPPSIVPPPGLAPQNTMPQLAAPPRLVPQPQAPTVPYAPP